MTLEIIGDKAAVSRISASLDALRRGERRVNITAVRAELARAVARRLPGLTAEVIEFCTSLAVSPREAGKPLFGPLSGCYCATYGSYRIIYRVEEEGGTVDVLDIGRRVDADSRD